MCPHVCIHEPKIGKLSPFISGHLVQHRTLAVHHFIMAKWKHEVLVVIVHHAKGKLIEPVSRAADEKRFYLSSFVIENIAVPIRMKSFAHIGVFVSVSAIEHEQAMSIIRKM